MKILVDTNVLLWILFDDSKLSKKDLSYINNENNEIILSSISLFEISLKYSLGKIKLFGVKPDDIPFLLLENGYLIENPDYKLFSSFYKLPTKTHKDPFDRLIIWEAINKNYYLLSRDSKFSEYVPFGLKLLGG